MRLRPALTVSMPTPTASPEARIGRVEQLLRDHPLASSAVGVLLGLVLAKLWR